MVDERCFAFLPFPSSLPSMGPPLFSIFRCPQGSGSAKPGMPLMLGSLLFLSIYNALCGHT